MEFLSNLSGAIAVGVGFYAIYRIMVAVKKQDFDVICPSDYMVERLKNEGLLVKLDAEVSAKVKQKVLGEEQQDGTYPNQDFMNLILESEFLLQEMALLSESLVLLECPASCFLYYTISI